MPTIKKLIADEHKAVRDYTQTASKVGPKTAKVLRHIRGEEVHHARELKKVKGGLTAISKSSMKGRALTQDRKDNLAAKDLFLHCGE